MDQILRQVTDTKMTATTVGSPLPDKGPSVNPLFSTREQVKEAGCNTHINQSVLVLSGTDSLVIPMKNC